MKRIPIALAKSLQAIGEGFILFLMGIGGAFIITLPVLTVKVMGTVADVIIMCSSSAYRWTADSLERAWK